MSIRWLQIILSVLVIFLASVLRWSQIDLRPFHADEAVQAYQAGKLIDGEGYRYDPADKHGPFLYYASAAIARIRGWSSSSLDETRLRSISAMAGIALLVLIAFHSTGLGPRRCLLALLFLAVAPMSILYQTYYVQEAWFCFFSWALLFACHRYFHAPGIAIGILLGLLVGLMQSSKETSIIHFAAIVGALILAGRLRGRDLQDFNQRHLAPIAAALATAVAVYVIFYSSFGSNPRGIFDGMLSYAHYANKAANSPQSQPWYAYLDILMPHRQEGVSWGETLLLICAAFGSGRAFLRKSLPLMRLSFWFTALSFVLYSIIPYKTPWLTLTPYVGMCIMAANGIMELMNLIGSRRGLITATALGVLCTGELAWRTYLGLFRYAGDERVPYFYQQTSADLPRLVARLHSQASPDASRPLRIAVCSPDHAWPLPWYLRDMKAVGYFESLEVPTGFDLVITDSRLNKQTASRTPSVRAPFDTFGLRPNVVLLVPISAAKP